MTDVGRRYKSIAQDLLHIAILVLAVNAAFSYGWFTAVVISVALVFVGDPIPSIQRRRATFDALRKEN